MALVGYTDEGFVVLMLTFASHGLNYEFQTYWVDIKLFSVILFCLLLCALLLAVVRSAGQVIRVAPCGGPLGQGGAAWLNFYYIYLSIFKTSPT